MVLSVLITIVESDDLLLSDKSSPILNAANFECFLVLIEVALLLF